MSFLPTTQHTRWDSSVHTVTQAFRHSLAPANTISVTFHYMVLGWISGLETHQISTQGALPPHPRYCLSTTGSNCFLFAFFLAKISISALHADKCTNWMFSLTHKLPDKLMVLTDKSKVAYISPSRGSSCQLWGFFQSKQLLKDPPHPALFKPVVLHMKSTCRLVKNLN